MTSVRKLAIPILVAWGLLAGGALADVYRVVFTGQTNGFLDVYGDFGPVGALYDAPSDFTAVFTVDDTGFTQSYYPENDFSQMAENSLTFAASYDSKITATLTMLGKTIDIISPGNLGGGYVHQEHNYPDCDICSFSDVLYYEVDDFSTNTYLSFDLKDLRGKSFLSSPITHDVYGVYDLSGVGAHLGNLDFPVDELVPAEMVIAAFVPEPGAWSLMILGFGGIGTALRRRPRNALA